MLVKYGTGNGGRGLQALYFEEQIYLPISKAQSSKLYVKVQMTS